jgi:hypothetical protein
VTAVFGIVTGEFGNVTGRSGDVTDPDMTPIRAGFRPLVALSRGVGSRCA